MAYMEGHEAKRLDPRLLVEGCRTVVSVALNYRPSTPIPDHKLQIAWYAYGQDYHDIMRQKLNNLIEALRHSTPEGTLQGRGTLLGLAVRFGVDRPSHPTRHPPGGQCILPR